MHNSVRVNVPIPLTILILLMYMQSAMFKTIPDALGTEKIEETLVNIRVKHEN